jgi:class 3 adenylate cyclase
VERRLAAVLAADVAGSCRLIGIDEEGTLARLKALRKTLFDPKVTDHHGRVVKNTGDGALVEFASVVDAMVAAAKNALQSNQNFGTAYHCLAAALAHLGRDAEVRKVVAQLLEIEPDFRISDYLARSGHWRAEMFIDGLRKAGLPE